MSHQPARAAVERSLHVVAHRDAEVHAWATLDPDRARREADAVDRRGRGDLRGLTFAAKDIFDTVDQPTGYGSAIYAGHRPAADAAVVALLRDAGAVCLGKTVTSEFAFYHPGPTTNPHRTTHTPGGSSMGSAAAVATGMVDFALGTQTAASIIRPASFCGVYGFKPSFGTVPVAGLKAVAPSLDTVGWFARHPATLSAVWSCLTGRHGVALPSRPLRVALVETEQWDACGPDSQRAVWDLARELSDRHAVVEVVGLPAELSGLADQHRVVMAYEAARALAFEHRHHRSRLSAVLCEFLDEGRATDPEAYDLVRHRIGTARQRATGLFADCDVILTPAVVGEAPLGLGSTGDPRFGRMWTMLGLPSVSVPRSLGATGLPVGVQLVGADGADGRLLAVTAWLASTLEQTPG